MSTYTPDRWQIITFSGETVSEPVFKVLGGWRGGYVSGEAWRLNSGIVEIVDMDQYYIIKGHSGSLYHCYKDSEGTTSYTQSILDNWKQQASDKISIEEVSVEDVISELKKKE